MKSISFLLFCIVFSVLRLSGAYSLGNETDRLALLAFKEQMNPGPSGRMSSWNDSDHFCDWEGVTCSHRRQRVIALNLGSQGLTGPISPYIGNLSFLRHINLQNNTLHGQIPQEIGRLFRLLELYMSNNSLSGSVPVNLSHCPNLEALAIAYNKLTGEIPEELGSCSRLYYLDLHMNSLTGRIPSSLGNLTSLEILYLSQNSLEGSIPSSLGKLKSVLYLLLAANNLSGMVPPQLYNISSLVQISIAVNQLEGNLPHDIGVNLPVLVQFLAGGNNFVGHIPVSLFSNSSKIQRLYLDENNFTGNVPIEIGRLKALRELNLNINHLGSGGKVQDLDFITSLNNCSDLKLLDISSNQFGGRLHEAVANLSPNLSFLTLDDNLITGSIPSQIGNLINLEQFSALSNFLTGTIPTSIGMLQRVQNLFLGSNRLSGRIPYSVGNMTALSFIALSDNMLEGNIITSFDKCPHLQVVYLDHNHLTGTVPKQLLGLSPQLSFIRLSHNYLTGSLPLEVGNLKNLNGLDISENRIVGEIPNTLGGCVVLEDLYLQGNFLHGLIPSSFSYLKGIQNIDLSRNNLSGKIPNDLQDLPFLKNLNLSFNNFENEIPKGGVFGNASEFSIYGNSKLCGGIIELHLPNCDTQKPKNNRLPLAVKIILGLLLPALVITALLLALYCKNKPSVISSTKQFLKNSLQRVSYNELREATNGFSSENLIGVGSFGSVYKGVHPKDECLIAVKVLNLIVQGASKSFVAECEILRRVRHRNLLKILTVCSSIDSKGDDFKALVFEFMSNGSLETWLHPSSDRSQNPSNKLNLLQMLNIAIDVAFALDYLHNHSQLPIIHCDLKPSNVLLDDNMVAYVGDFGLAKFLIKSTSNSGKSETNSIGVRGTIGYIPPEYGMGVEATTQGDVYSYGILLLEMFTGKRPTDEMFKDSQSLHSYCKSNTSDRVMEIMDMHLLLQETTDESIIDDIEEQRGVVNSAKEYLTSIIEVGVASSSEQAGERMNIKDVLSKMHKAKQVFVSLGNHIEM